MLLLASVASILPCLCFLRFCHSISINFSVFTRSLYFCSQRLQRDWSEMSSLSSLLLLQLLALAVALFGQKSPKFSRDDFPSDFVFGAGTSAYQVEGAAAEDGRTPSLWDAFTHEGKMPGNSTGDVAADGYHKYKEDVKIMSDIGLEGYRFSISWSRVLPNGRGTVNPKGLDYYNNLINELVTHGIEPHVTLFHLDFPKVLEDEYGGWLSPKIVEDFTAYADVCFREFGERVSHWTTINEPNVLDLSAYNSGTFPPHRCSPPGGFNCTAGNSSVEPYTVMHHFLLAHASAAALYREKYQTKKKGWIGLNVYSFGCNPLTNSTADAIATQRSLDFLIGWVVNPLMFGDYPDILKKRVGSRIPSFTRTEVQLVKGSFDFIGLNHYFTINIKDDSTDPGTGPPDFNKDMGVMFSASSSSGLLKLLEYFKNYYGNPAVYIQENGYGGPRNESLNDTARIDYLSGFMESMLTAIRNGSNAKGYFLWSFLVVFELLGGYMTRYGLVHVDFDDKELKRQPKLSAQWYSDFLKGRKSMNIKSTRDTSHSSSH